MRHITVSWVCLLALLGGWQPTQAAAGYHDFDFALGSWQTRILHLQHSPGKAAGWTVWTGTVLTAKVWNGRSNVQEIEVNTPDGRIEELRLCLYRPLLRQWYLYWADRDDGVLTPPMIGEFEHGVGKFYDQESHGDRVIFVRHLYSKITSSSYHWQQAFSDDGGTTWQPNWNVTLTRQSPAPAGGQGTSASAPSASASHAFDFAWGEWRSDISFLPDPFSSRPHWMKIHGHVSVRRLWGGQANLEEIEAKGPQGSFEGLTLRLYDPKTRQWYLYSANSKDGELAEPLVGDFRNARGVFYSQDTRAGRTVFVRNVYSDVTADSYRLEQALSDDGGRTWRTNLTARVTRAASRSS